MPTLIEPQFPLSLVEASIEPRGNVFPSPADWRDQFLYFLLPDRFSDGNENTRQAFDRHDPSLHETDDRVAWQISGKDFQGGTLNGIRSKLAYLKGLGITALWIGPIFRQRSDLDT